MTAYRAPTFTLAAPRERAWWERALVSVGRHVRAIRWLPAYRRAVGGRWALLRDVVRDEWGRAVWHRRAHWIWTERCPAEWVHSEAWDHQSDVPVATFDYNSKTRAFDYTRSLHRERCTCEVYP